MPEKYIGGGVILEPLQKEDWIFSGKNEIGGPILLQSGIWINHLPTDELQKKLFDTFGCVTFSAFKLIQILMIFKKFNKAVLRALKMIDENGKPNIAEHPTVVMSGTVPGRGNSLKNVAESIRKEGFTGEEVYPFPEGMGEREYYQSVPQNIQDQMLESLKYYEVKYEHVWNRDLGEALKYSPIQVIVDAGYRYDGNGVIMAKRNYNYNHAMVLVGKTTNHYLVYDSYKPFIKKFALNYKFGATKRYSVEELKGNSEKFLNRYEGRFVMGRHPGIYKIENGKKRPFAKWFDYLIYSGNKENFQKVDPIVLDMVPEGEVMNVKMSPYWPFVQAHYDMLKEMSAPDNMKRLDQILEREESTGESYTQHPKMSDEEVSAGGLWVAILNLLKKLIKF